MSREIMVEVVYALPAKQVALPLQVAPDTTVSQAIEMSGILQQFPEIDLAGVNKVGIFGKLAKLDAVVQDHDRIEIYRPLIADPKEIRRKRAEEGKTRKEGESEAGE
jgi:putative ubiquitin-RnfH superfamily antitoxin RatB of RatAB toxin-antitoxin module